MRGQDSLESRRNLNDSQNIRNRYTCAAQKLTQTVRPDRSDEMLKIQF